MPDRCPYSDSKTGAPPSDAETRSSAAEATDISATPSEPGLGRGSYWRSLSELQDSPEFCEAVGREFPNYASEWRDPVSRRSFLKLMTASAALAGINGCSRQPEEPIVPYVVPPERIVPGKPLVFATAMPWAGYGRGVLVESHMGRPIKIEGNPDHPASLGSTDAMTQASILDLWDPDRAQTVSQGGQVSTWGAFTSAWQAFVGGKPRDWKGGGVRILIESVTSPTLLSQLAAITQKYPEVVWHHFDPIGRDNARKGARLAFGQVVDTIYDTTLLVPSVFSLWTKIFWPTIRAVCVTHDISSTGGGCAGRRPARL
jgi:MoCo/4Fe-4S cofactor protein with predicted Tat translocation signal